MVAAIFIYNQKGEVLISRIFRDCRRSVADIARIHVIASPVVRSPIVTLGSTSFFHVRHENLYIVAITKTNANAALVFEYCYKLINLGKTYFGTFDEEAVRHNFAKIYEILDESMDYGYPQNSEADSLKAFISTEGIKFEKKHKSESSKLTGQVTGALSWRRGDVKYRKNEAFVDVIENVNLLLSATGTVLRADVNGQIMMRAYLSGVPECKFGLNDRLVLEKGDGDERKLQDAVTLDDCQFHQCVKLGKFDSERIISFVPPDGEFELMRYRSTANVNLPFKLTPVIREVGKSKVVYTVNFRSSFTEKISATNVVMRIPTPLNSAAVDTKTASGKAKYVPAENVIIWKFARMQGGVEHTLSATAELTSTTHQKAWSRPPITLDFQVLMFTASGLIVKFLKIMGPQQDYKSVKWVRYMTKAGSYAVRF